MDSTAASFPGVLLRSIDAVAAAQSPATDSAVTIRLRHAEASIKLEAIEPGSSAVLAALDIEKTTEWCRGATRHVLFSSHASIVLRFPDTDTSATFSGHLSRVCGPDRPQSAFERRTEDISAKQYFQFYGYLSQQQNMMLDFTRTSTYQRAFLQNAVDFKDKVVIDVGAGSGILSFFALQAGARKVYAIEGSSVAEYCELLVRHNKAEDKITVVSGKVEEVEIPEKADVIISEPMGYMLVNERMLETFIHARKWLKPTGKMFPTQGVLYVVPFTDDALYIEQYSKAYFWSQQSFHGVDLSSLRQAAIAEYFRQPIVDTFDHRILIAKPTKHVVNFVDDTEASLQNITIPLKFTALTAGSIHGLAFWFDVAFIGSAATVWLSTAPNEPLTHWYQVRCLIPTPLFTAAGQTVCGHVQLTANRKQSYTVDIDLTVEGTGTRATNTLDLKNPFFRYTGQPPQAPPGLHSASPTEVFWNTVSSAIAHTQGGVGTAAAAAPMPVASGHVVEQTTTTTTTSPVIVPVRSLNHSVSNIIGSNVPPLIPSASRGIAPGAGDGNWPVDGSTFSQSTSFMFNGSSGAAGTGALLTRPVYPDTSKFGKSHS